MNNLQLLLLVFVLYFLIFVGFGRIASNQKEWKEDRKETYDMAFWGAGVIAILMLIFGSVAE